MLVLVLASWGIRTERETGLPEYWCAKDDLEIPYEDSKQISNWLRELLYLGDSPVWANFYCRVGPEPRRYLIGVEDLRSYGFYLIDVAKQTPSGAEGSEWSTRGDPHITHMLTDKAGHPHAILCVQDLNHGIWRRYCELVRLDRLSREIVYGGVTNSGGAGCFESTKDVSNPVDSAAWFDYVALDSNRDGAWDIVVSITEQDCTTKQETKYRAVLLATDKGFERVEQR